MLITRSNGRQSVYEKRELGEVGKWGGGGKLGSQRLRM